MSTTTVSVLNPLLVTDGSISGDGIFDIWMRTLGAHLKREYAEQRITGDEYAKAYISLMNNLLNTAVGFLTQDAQLAMSQEQMRHDITISDAQLAMAQTKLTHDTKISDAQLVIEQDKLKQDTKISDAQLTLAQTKLSNETKISDARLVIEQSKLKQDITISDAQLKVAQDKLAQDIIISNAQLKVTQDKLKQDTKISDAQLSLAQSKLSYETQLLDAQVKHLSAQVSLANKELTLKDKDLALKDKQVALAEAQLKAAEVQYKDTVDGVPVGGVLGKQMKVYEAQAKGFKDNALQAAAKIMVDTWNIRRQTDEGLQTTKESKLYDGNIGSAIAEMFKSVSIPVVPAP